MSLCTPPRSSEVVPEHNGDRGREAEFTHADTPKFGPLLLITVDHGSTTTYIRFDVCLPLEIESERLTLDRRPHITTMANLQDYDLDHPIDAQQTGLRMGLTSYGDAHFSLFLRKVFIKAAGYSEDALSRPIVGIINTNSGFNPCHAQVPQLVEAVKRGVHLAGGLAIEFPTISLHESFSSPTSMYLRNLMSMDTEEMIKAQPVDVCIMIGGCDKTVPAQLMGGISANKPVLPLVVGPMMPGSFKVTRIGACTDCRSNWASYRAGEMDIEDIADINYELAPTVSGPIGLSFEVDADIYSRLVLAV
jgi:hypothetical protein